MLRKFFLFLLLVFCFALFREQKFLFTARIAYAAEDLITISENTVWTKANSPYIIPQVLYIQSGARLTIEPGTVLKLGDFYTPKPWEYRFKIGIRPFSGGEICVEGELFAQGTINEPVLFTSFKDDSVLGDTNEDGESVGKRGDWAGIYAQAYIDTKQNTDPIDDQIIGAKVVLNYVEMRYGGKKSYLIDSAPVFAQIYLGHSNLHNNSTSVIRIEAAENNFLPQIKIEKTNFYDNLWSPTAAPGSKVLYYTVYVYSPTQTCYKNPTLCENAGFENNKIELANNWWDGPDGPLVLTFYEYRFSPDWIQYYHDPRTWIYFQGMNEAGLSLQKSKTSYEPYLTKKWSAEQDGGYEPYPISPPPPPPPPNNEIDPLLLKYLPILYFHSAEDFYPMNVEDFVASSALWQEKNSVHNLIQAEDPNNPLKLEDLTQTECQNNPDCYLQFSEDLKNKTPDPLKAKTEYQALRKQAQAPYTVYSYKTEDSYLDEQGEKQEFIVLEYWYFYAFNDFGAKVPKGNNHEGDWETVMVFLDKETQMPLYAAFSAHHNKGSLEIPIWQFDSVRRSWSDKNIQKEDTNILSFVALGSHANYPEETKHKIIFFPSDITSNEGKHFYQDQWMKLQEWTILPEWLVHYEGLWGVNSGNLGSMGPESPYKSEYDKFREPVKWAGLDKIGKKTIYEQGIQAVEFVNQGIKISFAKTLEIGTEIKTDLHNEFLSFGENLAKINFLPYFWEIESSLENYQFNAEVALNYNLADLSALDIQAENLKVFFYDQTKKIWQKVESRIDLENQKIIFSTDHFSKYALGAEKEEKILNKKEIKIKISKERYKQKDNFQKYEVELFNKSQAEITGNLILVIKQTSLPNIEILNADGITEDGLAYFDFSDDYYFCKYAGSAENIPKRKVPQRIQNRIINQYPPREFSCNLKNQYPILDPWLEKILPTQRATERKELRFDLTKEQARYFWWEGEARNAS